MCEQAREGAARPLYSSAPQNAAIPGNSSPADAAAKVPPEETAVAPDTAQGLTFSPPSQGAPAALPAKSLPSKAFVAAALLSYPLAYYYVDRIFNGGQRFGSGLLLFTLLFLAGVEALARAENRPMPRFSVFWAVCCALQGGAMALYGPHIDSLGMWQMLAWHLTIIYWVLARTGMLAAGHSGSLLFLDGATGLFLLPWPNFFRRIVTAFHGLSAVIRNRKGDTKPGSHWPAVAGSVLLALLVCGVAWGQLAAADTHFAAIGGEFFTWLDLWLNDFRLWEVAGRFILSLPVGAWLFGLVSGALQRRAAPCSQVQFYTGTKPLRRLPAVTVWLVVGSLCAVYALFFTVQAAEFLPNLGHVGLTAPAAADFAVDGFWELLRILLLNFSVLAGIHFFAAQPLRENLGQKLLATLFCLFGIAFAGLAAAKLWTYVALYGATPRRVLSGWFLCVLALWAMLACVWVWAAIPAARIGIVALAAGFTLLCCCNVEQNIARYNIARYAAGQDASLDTDILADCNLDDAPGTIKTTQALVDSGWFIGQEWRNIRRVYRHASVDDAFSSLYEASESDEPFYYPNLEIRGPSNRATLRLTLDSNYNCTAAALSVD